MLEVRHFLACNPAYLQRIFLVALFIIQSLFLASPYQECGFFFFLPIGFSQGHVSWVCAGCLPEDQRQSRLGSGCAAAAAGSSSRSNGVGWEMGTGAVSFLFHHVNHVTLWLSAALFSTPLVFCFFTFCPLVWPMYSFVSGGGRPHTLCYGCRSTVRGIFNSKWSFCWALLQPFKRKYLVLQDCRPNRISSPTESRCNKKRRKKERTLRNLSDRWVS